MDNTNRKSQRGLATLETLPLLAIFVLLASYTIGFFGVVHTGILHSIAARTYAFETFRNRTDLSFFRHNLPPNSEIQQYLDFGFRMHGIGDPIENDTDAEFFAPQRFIAFGRSFGDSTPIHNDSAYHLTDVHNMPGKRNRKIEVNPVWIMMSYGICLNAPCGD